MGGGSYSSVDYRAAKKSLDDSGAAFRTSARASSTGDYTPSEILDPTKMKNSVRESCFAPGCDSLTPIVVGLDCTGSMGVVPGVVQKQLPDLIDTIVEQGVTEHPNLMFIGFDDEHSVKNACFQMSQFEISSDKVLESLNELIIPMQGGANRSESYHLFFYALANHTKLESFDEYGEKAFAFLICDESPFFNMNYKKEGTRINIAESVFGDIIQSEVSMLDSIKKTAERYEIFIIRPKHTSNGSDKSITKEWQDIMTEAGVSPQHVLEVDDEHSIISTITLCISNLSGLDTDAIVDVLKARGASGVDAAASAVKDLATVSVGASTALGEISGDIGSTNLPVERI